MSRESYEEKRRVWVKRIEKWKASGHSGRRWSAQEGLNYRQFQYWKEKLSSEPECKPSFIEFPKEHSSGITFEYEGVEIYVSRNFNPWTLQKFLEALRDPAC
jgi:hypothetical protein